eukprot:CAMPEP_0170180728 /NCGR_PEP_ID=MMETSP0040_2-20121228/22805_1 /TAXON_ID=641309 /ORGANISM="Lotharella oceanica, Strain CCMP622" /LENGTH=114 /DNA_ID=CAMNT_0010425465 /DNA_START=135 /DNA_END=479 /DNA_ORIENTATION=-
MVNVSVARCKAKPLFEGDLCIIVLIQRCLETLQDVVHRIVDTPPGRHRGLGPTKMQCLRQKNGSGVFGESLHHVSDLLAVETAISVEIPHVKQQSEPVAHTALTPSVHPVSEFL